MVDSTIRVRSGRIRQYEQFFVCALNIGGWYFEVNGFSWGRQLKESNSGKFVYILVDAIRCSEHTHRHTTCRNEKQLCKARMKTIGILFNHHRLYIHAHIRTLTASQPPKNSHQNKSRLCMTFSIRSHDPFVVVEIHRGFTFNYILWFNRRTNNN